ncbi:MAG: DUF2283 domain-containing protein [Gammaproteobacteria bacterium]|nr:DUF2283 domain-containing protein [Gammaproteobacteria bacterium]
MNIRYFTETDTLYIEFRDAAVVETRHLDEDTLIDTRLTFRCGLPDPSLPPPSPLPSLWTIRNQESARESLRRSVMKSDR